MVNEWILGEPHQTDNTNYEWVLGAPYIVVEVAEGEEEEANAVFFGTEF